MVCSTSSFLAISRPEERLERVARVRQRVLIAAVFAFLMLLPVAGIWWQKRGSVVAPPPDVVTLRTADLDDVDIPLPDGSHAVMAARSTLEYLGNFTTTREMKLLGKARFEVVTGGSAKPFVVHTRTALITVTGTSFTVSAPAQRPTVVTVHRGNVAVQSLREDGTIVPGIQIVQPGQTAYVPLDFPPKLQPPPPYGSPNSTPHTPNR
jgi:ferric-dicitrate binding protein FerR (iron transport regulator)